MPFIDVRTPVKFNEEETSALQIALLDIVSEEMDKGMDTIMIGIKDNTYLSLGRHLITKGAFIEVKAFGKSSKEAKENVCARINNLLLKDFGFNLQSIYITFDEKEVWGYKGQFLS